MRRWRVHHLLELRHLGPHHVARRHHAPREQLDLRLDDLVPALDDELLKRLRHLPKRRAPTLCQQWCLLGRWTRTRVRRAGLCGEELIRHHRDGLHLVKEDAVTIGVDALEGDAAAAARTQVRAHLVENHAVVVGRSPRI